MTEQEFQTRVLSELAGMRVGTTITHSQLARLEAAVLGNPAGGVEGLLSRVKSMENLIPSKSKRALINAGTGFSGGAVVAFIAEVWPYLKDVLSG